MHGRTPTIIILVFVGVSYTVLASVLATMDRMAIAVATTRQALANTYASTGTWVGAATGDPGTTGTPSNEASGGSPAYQRQQTTWTAGAGGIQNGSAVTINVAAATYTYILLASAQTGNTMIDKAAISSVVMSAQGQLVVTPAYTQT